MSLHLPDSQPETRAERLNPAERRQRLAVLCALDRVQLRLVLAPPRRTAEPPVGGVPDGLQTMLDASRFLPGKLGIWSRRVGLAASLIRLVR